MKRWEIRESGEGALSGGLGASLSAQGPLAGIAPAVIADVVRASAMLELAAGEFLIREGEPATPEVFLLVEGALEVKSGGALIARLDRIGAVVGEAAVMLGSRRNADVLADGAVRVLAVPGEVLKRPEFADVAAGVRAALLRDDWVQY